MKQYDFLTRLDYFRALGEAAKAAKPNERFILATMDFDPEEPHIAELIISLRQAAKRRVAIVFIVDAISLLTSDHGLPKMSLSLNKLKTGPRAIAARHRALEELQAAGAKCHIVNIPKRRVGLVQRGRSHIKCAVSGDELFVGGCNLTKPEQIDVMVRLRNKHAADTLAGWLMRIAEHGQTRSAFGDVDVEVAIDDQASLLLDAGVPKQSVIYDAALDIIDRSRDWLYITCQYFPGGSTARHLASAQDRGVDITIKYSHPRAHKHGAILHHAHQLAQRGRGLPRPFFSGRLDKKSPKLHAKILVSERAAMLGSHNYISQGVNFGTAELALKSTDPGFGMALRHFITAQISRHHSEE